MKEEISYKGKKVFIGIDVHKKSYSICAVVEGEVVYQRKLLADPRNLVEQLGRFKDGERYTVYEAGFSGFGLHRYLEERGIKNIVVNPASIPVAKKDRVKTDKRDARKLASELSHGSLRSIRIPSNGQEVERLITRARARIVKKRTAVRNEIWMKLYQFGYIGAEQSLMSLKWIEAFVKREGIAEEMKIVLECSINQWRLLNGEILLLNKQISKRAKESKEIAILRSIPGIGELSACVIANELGDMKQFSADKKLYSFVGLTPSEESSGDSVRRGHITRQGRPELRALLVQCAWVAIRDDKGLATVFRRIASHRRGQPGTGNNARKAIVAIAKRLLGIARALLRDGRMFEPREVAIAA